MSKKLNKTITLSNGVEVRTNPSRPAGYKGVSFYGASQEKPFIAFLDKSLIEDWGMEELVDHQRSTMIHLGWYSSVTEAAYVAAMGYADKDGMEYMLSFHQVSGKNHSGSGELYVDFPSDLDVLPESITASDAWTQYKDSKKKAVKAVTKSKEREAEEDAAKAAAASKPLNGDNACEIRMNIMEQYGMNFLCSLDVIAKSDIRMLTWEEWKKKHGGDV